ETHPRACGRVRQSSDRGTPLQALDGLTVLDLSSHIAGPYATKMLADLGARVIKIERPGGDSSRTLGPFLNDKPGTDSSGTFQFLNTNKQGIVLDLIHAESEEVLRRAVTRADLVVTSFPPKTEERLHVDYESLRRFADVPVLSITNFGHSGPYRDYQLSETVLYAMGGEMFSHGLSDREPLKLGGTAALLQCGAMAGLAAMGALHAWELHHIAQLVEVSLFDAQINSADRRTASILAYRFSGRVQDRPAGASSGIAGGIYPVADGYVEVTASVGSYWQRFVDMIDDDALRTPKWLLPQTAMDPTAKEEADAIIYPWMLSHTRNEVWTEARRAHAMVAPLFTGADIYHDPVFRERGLWTEVHHQTLGAFPMLARPYVFEKTPWALRSAAPMLGEHTDVVLQEFGYTTGEIRELRTQGVVA
ncbi:MAG: CoA transferase, partial [Tepidiformaceae bacterium]